MEPEGRIARVVQTATVWVFSLLLTIATGLWWLITLETLTRFVAGTRGAEWMPLTMTLIAGVSLVTLVVFRSIRVVRGRRGLRLAALHGGCLTGLFTWLYHARPAAATGHPFAFLGSGRDISSLNECWSGGPRHPSYWCAVFENDVVTRFAFYSLVLAVMVFVALLLGSLRGSGRTWSGMTTSPLLGVGVSVLIATVLLHTTWSAIRLAVDWTFTYLDTHLLAWDFLDHSTGTTSIDSVVKVWDVKEARFYGPDAVNGLLLPLLLALFVALVVRLAVVKSRRFVRSSEPGREPSRFQLWRTRAVHDLIAGRSLQRVTLVLLSVVVSFAWASAWWWSWLGRPVERNPTGWIADVSVLSVHLLFVVVVLLALSPSLRRPLSMVGDVVGFWDAGTHPLAGNPYRPHVVQEIVRELQSSRSVALVGHSQGSILAFAALRTAPPEVRRRVHLVTCGSPLCSLYARFFPRRFDAGTYELVRKHVPSWGNFWRDTDPIASPVLTGSEKSFEDVPIPDPAPGSTGILGHGDYWIDERQRAWIAGVNSEPTG